MTIATPPKILYKYRPLNDFAWRILRSGEIYFAAPNELNDPNEYFFTCVHNDIYRNLADSELKILELLGIKPHILKEGISGTLLRLTGEENAKLLIYSIK